MARPSRDPLIGLTVGGRYRLISRIGSGGMSNVYLSRHVLIDRLMAIKTLRRDLAREPVQRDRFLREARAVNRINHLNIVEITDFGETDDGLVYLVMEYVPGEPLLETMSRGPMSEVRVLSIARQCGSALARAHQMGVIHRDLKPENILLVSRRTEPDFVKVLDFGIAKILDAPSLTGSQQIFGTPGYIAPEYIQSTSIDGRADLYSLGVILYELTTGALPFDYQYPGDLLVKHVTELPIAPQERLGTVSDPMNMLILRCLEKRPDDRFRDAFHFLEEVEKVWEQVVPDGETEDPQVRESPTLVGTGFTRGESPTVELRPSETDARHAKTLLSAPPQHLAAATEEDRVSALDPFIPEAPLVEAFLPTHARTSPNNTPLELYAQETHGGELGRAVAFEPMVDGIGGVKRWRRRFEALRTHTDRIRPHVEVPSAVERGLSFASETLPHFESAAAGAGDLQMEAEGLNRGARQFRAELGDEIDHSARRLSKLTGELQALGGDVDDLKVGPDSGLTGNGVWELAAASQRLANYSIQRTEAASDLRTLRASLEHQNENVENRLRRTVELLNTEMTRIDALSSALRLELDMVEGFVFENFHLALKSDPN